MDFPQNPTLGQVYTYQDRSWEWDGTGWKARTAAFAGVSENLQTGTAYTLQLTDAFVLVVMDNAADNTITVPPDSSVAWKAGTRIDLGQDGVGRTTVVAGAGVTIRTPETLRIRKQWGKAMLIRRGANLWDIEGNLELSV